MGLGLGLENGSISEENLVKARSMVPRALEQYVNQLAKNGGSAVEAMMPKVSDPAQVVMALKSEPQEEIIVQQDASELQDD